MATNDINGVSGSSIIYGSELKKYNHRSVYKPLEPAEVDPSGDFFVIAFSPLGFGTSVSLTKDQTTLAWTVVGVAPLVANDVAIYVNGLKVWGLGADSSSPSSYLFHPIYAASSSISVGSIANSLDISLVRSTQWLQGTRYEVLMYLAGN